MTMIMSLESGGRMRLDEQVTKKLTIVSFSDTDQSVDISLYVRGRLWKTVTVRVAARDVVEIDIPWFVDSIYVHRFNGIVYVRVG